jgi:signal transduction histidine kinase
MIQNPGITLAPDEQDVYQGFDIQRRRKLIERISPFVSVGIFISFCVAAVFLFSSVINDPNSDQTVAFIQIAGSIVFAIIASCLILVAKNVARRKRLTLATTLMCYPVFLSILGLHFIVFLAQAKDQIIMLFSVYSLVIIMAGLLGNRRFIVGITITTLVTVMVLGLVLKLGYPDTYPTDFIISLFLFQHSAIGILMYVFFDGFGHAIHELGKERLANDRARRVDDIKNQFISNVNHELRTPIMALQGFIELYLLSEGLPESEKRELIEEASEVSNNLVSLVQSILDIRRLDYGVVNFTPEALNAHQIANSGKIFIRIPRQIRLWGEPVRVRQILTNLVSNAIKYSPDGSPIELSGSIIKDEKNEKENQYMCEIRVRDYGYGIPPEQIPLLFQRFVRLPRDLASSIRGNGLGLYLCRNLAQSMEGRIWVESMGIEGEGSTFFLQLPLPPGDMLASALGGVDEVETTTTVIEG